MPFPSIMRAATRLTLLLWGGFVASLAGNSLALAAESGANGTTAVQFRRDIQPLLAQRCFRCHGPDQAEGGLRLNSRDRALAELDSGAHAIVPGSPDESALLERITATDDGQRMPPEEKPLTPEQVHLIREWIAAGAQWQGHWAYEPLTRPAVPTVQRTDWGNGAIDSFILSGLEARGLSPAAPADSRSLLRRIYYDLTGLPPTPEQVEAFQADASPDAYERVVDELLASPRYGERWARHWLDLVRYADTNSFERDGVKPNAWRYRDYVIRALNDDKPYDQFIREQLAGDELPEITTETLIATGFYRLGLWDDEPADVLQARYDELDDIVGTTGQVFLGLTVNCARCHDHKLDPIPQADYYRLLAFFSEIDRYHTQNSQVDVSPPEITAQYDEVARQRAGILERMKPIEEAGIVKMSAEDQRKTEGNEREKVLNTKLRAHVSEESWKEYQQCRAELAQLKKRELPPRDTVLGIGQCLSEPPKTFVLMRGNPHVPGDEVTPAYLTVLGGGAPPETERPAGAKSAGRRKLLADWIASPTNPLTARVMANRVWQHHFGRGLVRSSSNFGSLGTAPTHPELLDWLASELIDGGWRLKSLHRQIVTSAAYRMASTDNSQASLADPENDSLWRFDMRRLGAEEVRDSILAITGQLNLAMYGPGVFPHLSPEVLATQSMPGNGWSESPREEQHRRSIYVHVKRSLVLPILAEFDVCDADGSCAVRFSTTQPTQALSMLNGDFAHEQAQAFAERLQKELPDGDAAATDRQRVERALRLATGTQPTVETVEQGCRLIASLQTEHGLSAAKALEYYCLLVLNLNEFVFLD